MRATVDLPDALFRRTKALAALRGSSMKDLIVRAIEREVSGGCTAKSQAAVKLPLIKSKTGREVDLSDFDFDDLILGYHAPHSLPPSRRFGR
jgi:hypothetical protein